MDVPRHRGSKLPRVRAGQIGRLAFAISICCATFSFERPAAARQAVSFAGPSAQGGPAVFADTISVSDVFVGRNVVGPYLLAWKKVEAGTEIVYRGPRRLTRDADYRLDSTAGTLTFTVPLHAREIARIDYHYDPKTASANTGGFLPPVQL